MRLRTWLNLVVAALSAAFVIVLIAAEIEATRDSVREEIEAANRVASQLLGQLTTLNSQIGGPPPGARGCTARRLPPKRGAAGPPPGSRGSSTRNWRARPSGCAAACSCWSRPN